MEFQCQPKPRKPSPGNGRAQGAVSLDDMDRLCWSHMEALPYDYSHPIWRGEGHPKCDPLGTLEAGNC